MKTYSDLLEQFEQANNAFVATLQVFPKNRHYETLFSEWNILQVVSHYSAWTIYFTDTLPFLERSEEPLYWGSINTFNEEAVSAREQWQWDAVYAEFIDCGDAFVQAYSSLDEAKRTLRFWPKRSYTPRKFLEINLHHYTHAQFLQIQRMIH